MPAATTVVTLVGVTGLLALAARFEWYVARLPEPDCTTSVLSEAWSSDHAYKAAVLEKVCNLRESVFYSVRVDAPATPLSRGWFVPGFELENDTYPKAVPLVRWAKPRELEIEVPTRTLAGTLVVSVGEDLTVVRRYAPTEPGAHPNWH